MSGSTHGLAPQAWPCLVQADELMAWCRQGRPLVLLDCGFDLANPAAGRAAWEAGHLPGAHYAHLDLDLSGPRSAAGPSQGGRHPLPDRAAWAERVARWGIGPDTAVVAYDDQGGPYAARAWWLLRWLGHETVSVLDGGKAAWRAAGGTFDTAQPEVRSDLPAYPASAEPGMPVVDAQTLLASLGHCALFDARAPERFRGEVEPLDARAGHIPGARNRFFKDNLGPDGRFLPAPELRRAWEALLPATGTVIHQCGSGVTACHNLLAAVHAGLGVGALYAGSWSEWSADPARPCAVG